ncbi:MAG: adenylosuccinate synthetase, partial [bacterium]|nr:adenylosuccinate synthetase [bacterium]
TSLYWSAESVESMRAAAMPRVLEKLPDAARRYVEKVEELTGLSILAISTGPERSQTILHPDPLLP